MYEKKFWDDRYSGEKYIYGTEPNSFLAENVNLINGPVLSLSEGEGRNAVYLALRGLEVLGVDISEVALTKAEALAKSKNVKIKTQVADLSNFIPKKNFYNCVISISAHLPSLIRKRLYPHIEICLKPNGLVLLEAYSENQLARDTGGPKDIDMLMSLEKLKVEFPNFEPLIYNEIERDVCEGEGHTGLVSVVQFIGRKKA